MARKTTSKRKTSKRSSRSSSRKHSSKLGKQLQKISQERKKDIIGILLVIFGIILLLGFIGTSDGNITNWVVLFLGWIAGYGGIIFPFVLIMIGLWFIVRNEKKFPMISLERLLGIIFVYLNILSWMHWFGNGGWETARMGQGGGYIGAIFEQLFVIALGDWGAFVVLFAWLLVALVFTFDVSIPDLFRGVGRNAAKTGAFIKKQADKATKNETRIKYQKNETQQSFPSSQDEANGFVPIKGKRKRTLSIQNSKPQKSLEKIPQSQKSSDMLQQDGAYVKRVYQSVENSVKWKLPDFDTILNPNSKTSVHDNMDIERAKVIEDTLASFDAPAHVVEIHRGPTITQFGLEPDFVETRKGKMRVRVNKITSLSDDLALALAASRIRIQAPVPGRKYIGIEVPNTEAELVSLRQGIESKSFKQAKGFLKFVLGKDVAGKPISVDLAAMPHLLIAGTTGSGKSVCLNAILSCLLLHRTPNEMRLVMVDPKRVELTGYNGIPHLLTPVIVETEKVVGTLQWMSREMDSRYHKFAEVGARNIVDFNAMQPKKLPYIIVVVDELADLMMMAPEETERNLNRLAQLARATGIHVIIATQRPSVDVITGMIKANFPARISFAVVSGVDSRVILDQPGAERLMGRGDMLFQAPDAPASKRLQGVFVSNAEIQRLVHFWTRQANELLPSKDADNSQNMAPTMQPATLTEKPPLNKPIISDEDPYLQDAIRIVREEERASISMLQRRLKIGYTRAARMVDRMEELEIIGKPDSGLGVRPVIDFGDEGI